jgi:D-glycero-alpha-D-manno-heptose-7-phosphate kinase
MIITRSPLRITLGGGGTDLPSYYHQFGGFLVSAAIDKYVFVTVMRPFTPGIFLKYSQLEKVQTVNDIQHPILREAIRMLDFKTPQLEITTLADIPTGTGLGSSGSFTTALLKALFAHRRRLLLPDELAVNAYPLQINMDTLFDLEDNLLLFFTGYSRNASDILKDQDKRSKEMDEDMLNNMHYVKDLGLHSKEALITGRTSEFGELLHEHWEHKRKRSKGISNPQIDEWYELGMKNGALGGKLVGAGGGGFLMFYAKDRNRLRHAMSKAGLEEVRFSFDFEGTKTLIG